VTPCHGDLPVRAVCARQHACRVEGTVPKMIGGLLCRDASMSCDDRRFPTPLSLSCAQMGQWIRQTPVSGVVRLHRLWVLADVCGLSASIVGLLVFNVVLWHFLFVPIVGCNLICLWVHAILIVGRYTYECVSRFWLMRLGAIKPANPPRAADPRATRPWEISDLPLLPRDQRAITERRTTPPKNQVA
jgi:hypothetical protein